MAGSCQNKGRGKKNEAKEGRDGPKWPAPCQNKGWGGEKWSEKKAETDLNGRPLPK